MRAKKSAASISAAKNAMAKALRQRDAAIFKMRRDGDTLEAIGARFEITRERVRQIIANRGAADVRSAKCRRGPTQDFRNVRIERPADRYLLVFESMEHLFCIALTEGGAIAGDRLYKHPLKAGGGLSYLIRTFDRRWQERVAALLSSVDFAAAKARIAALAAP